MAVIVVIAIACKSPSIPEATIATSVGIASDAFQDGQHATGKTPSYTFDVIGLRNKNHQADLRGDFNSISGSNFFVLVIGGANPSGNAAVTNSSFIDAEKPNWPKGSQSYPLFENFDPSRFKSVTAGHQQLPILLGTASFVSR